jgi:(E)-4-hydroxy-3-methylbut-2-enyl-diphosphate synthase
MNKRAVKIVKVGRFSMGDGNVTVQSMLNRPSSDIDACVEQARELEAAHCDIIRAAVPKPEDAKLIAALKSAVAAPIVADVHFDYRAAIEAVAAGADKIRINPGNIGDESRVKAVISACKAKNVPIRVGVNGGSLEKDLLARYGSATADALAESALRNAKILERFDFDDIVLSVKSSDVMTTILAYRILAEKTSYPLHIGVTEAGTEYTGAIRSAAGIGALLADGIGETVRVSLTANPLSEVKVGRDILAAFGLIKRPTVISCPTCGRTKIDVATLAAQVESAVSLYTKPIKIAVMGCAVNGPGEARDADFGIAGGDGEGLLFMKGKIAKKVEEAQLFTELMNMINRADSEEKSYD